MSEATPLGELKVKPNLSNRSEEYRVTIRLREKS